MLQNWPWVGKEIAGASCQISLPVGAKSVDLTVDIALPKGGRGACFLSFADGALREIPPGSDNKLAISTDFGKPFFYVSGGIDTRIISLPNGCEHLHIHVLKWGGRSIILNGLEVAVNRRGSDLRALAEGPSTPTAAACAHALQEGSLLDPGGSPVSVKSVIGGAYYSHHVRVEPLVPTPSLREKVSLLKPRFYDATLDEVPSQSRIFTSEQEGAFQYLSADTDNVVSLQAPSAATYYGYSIKNWTRSKLIVTKDEFSLQGHPIHVQTSKIQCELDLLLEGQSRDVFVIYTGTTLIGAQQRANRSMMMADCLARRGCSVIYVYYRSDKNVSIIDPQPTTYDSGGAIVQIPNDLFAEFSDMIAERAGTRGKGLISVPDAAAIPLLNNLRAAGWPTAYEARDDWEEFHRVGAARWYSTAFERYLAANADMTISVSPPLRDKCVAFGCNADMAHILPNGAGRLFHDITRSVAERGQPKPGSLGYFGHLTEQWFDWNALRLLAMFIPDVPVDIIGHGHQPADLPSNVRLLGPKSHEEIIALARDWEIGLIPFVPGRLANAVDPIKLYEYLCLGIKVVSVHMAAIQGIPNVYLYENSNDIVKVTRKARQETFDADENGAFCKDVSWESRTDMLISLFDEAAR